MIKNRKQQIVLIIASILVLGISILFPPHIQANNQGGSAGNQAGATSSGGTPAKPVTQGDIGREIKLATGVTMALKEMYLIPTESGQIAYIHVDVKNTSSQPFDFYPYWLRVQSKYGERFKVSYVDEQRSSKVFPQSTRSFSYFAELPHQFTNQDIQIQVIKWDFSTSHYERLVHSFLLPTQLETAAIAEGEQGQIDVLGVPINIEVTNARVIESALRKTGSFTVSFLNQGYRAVKLPAYEYSLQGQGFTFPAEKGQAEEGIILLPRVEKKITVRVPMAVDADIKQYRLVIAEPKQGIEPSFSVPKTSFVFSIPEGSAGGLAVGDTTTIMYGAFDFDIKVQNIHLLPTTNLDNMLAYDVYITNKNNTRVALPELSSYVHVKNETPKLATQKEEAKKELFPDEELKLTMYATLPDKANVNDLQITFESSLGAQPGGDPDALAEVYAAYNVSLGSVIREGALAREEHHFSDLGDKSIIKPYQTTTYETNYSKILVSQFVIENKEGKPLRVPEYKGYYKSATGAMFPVKYKGKEGDIINPEGSAVVTFWAEVSKGHDLKEMNLVLGIPIDKESEAITEPVRFQVVGASNPVNRSTAYPTSYHISSMQASAGLREEVRRVYSNPTDENEDGSDYFREIGSVTVEYNLRKDYKANILPDGYERNLTFELLDSSGNVRDRREGVSLDKEILSGKNMLSLSANVPLYEVFSLRVRVYENFEHGRQLIGTYSISF